MTKIKIKSFRNFLSEDNAKKNFQENFYSLALIALTTALAAIFIFYYCRLFYDFGILAKERLLKNPLLAFFTTPFLFWISAYLCRRFARKSAGITLTHIESSLIQLKKTPESVGKVKTALNFRSVIVSALSSLLATFGGGALGREAPSVYMSASIFVIIAQKFKKFLPQISLKAWICAGTYAGFAIAFHAPIAALVYVAEKIFYTKSKIFLNEIFWMSIPLLMVILVLQKSEPLFGFYGSNFRFSSELLLIILIAVVCGIVALFFKKISTFFYQKVEKIESGLWHLIPIICGFVVSFFSFYGGINSFSGGIKTAEYILAGGNVSYDEVFARIINTFLTFIAGCAGGLVAPAVAIGAGIGSVFSQLFENVDARIFILSGMVSFLSPILLTPFAAAMVIVESSGQKISIFPLLFFCAVISLLMTKIITRFGK